VQRELISVLAVSWGTSLSALNSSVYFVWLWTTRIRRFAISPRSIHWHWESLISGVCIYEVYFDWPSCFTSRFASEFVLDSVFNSYFARGWIPLLCSPLVKVARYRATWVWEVCDSVRASQHGLRLFHILYSTLVCSRQEGCHFYSIYQYYPILIALILSCINWPGCYSIMLILITLVVI
jgi:hypothetical protein